MTRQRQTPEEAAAEMTAIRNALARSIEVHGLRHTARELRMSPTGLHGLVEGRRAYTQTERKLRAWWAGWEQRQGNRDTAEDAALRVLVATVPAEQRNVATGRLQEVLAGFRA